MSMIDLVRECLWDEVQRIEGKPGLTVAVLPKKDDGIFWVRREDVDIKRNNGSDR